MGLQVKEMQSSCHYKPILCFCLPLSASFVLTNWANLNFFCLEYPPLFPLCVPVDLFEKLSFFFAWSRRDAVFFFTWSVWMLHRRTDGWFPPFSDSYVDGCAVAEEARETPRRMKQITAAQPSLAVSVCGDCTGNPAEIKWMQAYTQTNSHTHTLTCTHS